MQRTLLLLSHDRALIRDQIPPRTLAQLAFEAPLGEGTRRLVDLLGVAGEGGVTDVPSASRQRLLRVSGKYTGIDIVSVKKSSFGVSSDARKVLKERSVALTRVIRWAASPGQRAMSPAAGTAAQWSRPRALGARGPRPRRDRAATRGAVTSGGIQIKNRSTRTVGYLSV